MKRICFLTILFVLLLHSPICFAQAQNATDYMEFDESGYLYAFKKTAPDGSFIEVSPALKSGTQTARVKIVCSDGEIFEGSINLVYWPDYKEIADRKPKKEVERVYKEYASNAESFDTAINKITSLAGRFKSWDMVAMCSQPDGTILVYSDGDELEVDSILISLGKEDFMMCNINRDARARYLNKSNLNDTYVESLRTVRKKFPTVDALLGFRNSKMEGRLTYNDGSSYFGSLSIDGVDCFDWKYWMSVTNMPDFKYVDGILMAKDGAIKVYAKGQYDEFETIRKKQIIAQNGFSDDSIVDNPKDYMRTLDATSRVPGKFNGDWKATYHPEWSSSDLTLIMHIKGFTGSYEKSRRSPGDPKELPMSWDYSGNRIEAAVDGKTFVGTLQNGKIVGEYLDNGKVYRVTFVKTGSGAVNTNTGGTVNRKTGMVIY